MKSIYIYLLAVLFLVQPMASFSKQGGVFVNVRNAYKFASQSPNNLAIFKSSIEAIKFGISNENAVLIEAYNMAANLIAGKFEKNFITRLRLLRSNLKGINRLVESNPNIIELRFVRHSLLSNIPKQFSNKRTLKSDLQALKTFLDNIKVDTDFSKFLGQYLLSENLI